MFRWFALTFAVLPGMAVAEEDYMETQRCVWRCMASTPNWGDNPAYGQCVEANCNEPAAAPAPSPTVAPPSSGFPAWTSGATADGQGRYAGQFAAETGNLLYYTCDANGLQNLLLSGEVAGPDAVLTLDADGQVLGLWFAQSPGGYTAQLDPGSPVPELLMRARRVELRNEAGWSLGLFRMDGARAAISSARASCGL